MAADVVRLFQQRGRCAQATSSAQKPRRRSGPA